MEEWTVVEEKYESLARTDPSHADKIKQEMADQFEVEYKERLFIFSSLSDLYGRIRLTIFARKNLNKNS